MENALPPFPMPSDLGLECSSPKDREVLRPGLDINRETAVDICGLIAHYDVPKNPGELARGLKDHVAAWCSDPHAREAAGVDLCRMPSLGLCGFTSEAASHSVYSVVYGARGYVEGHWSGSQNWCAVCGSALVVAQAAEHKLTACQGD